MGSSYNGYSWKQREGILRAEKRLARDDPLLAYLQSKGPCEICNDPGAPNAPHTQWHSEDYSMPYLFSPPATYILCTVCHQRLHKRFPSEAGMPSDWDVFLAHVRSGGYGREFTSYPRAARLAWKAQIVAGETVNLHSAHPRKLSGQEWWQNLSLDPESMTAPWARPRPWLARPLTDEYKAALSRVRPSGGELALLRAHANFPRRCATMRQLAASALNSTLPSQANLIYGTLAHRLADALASKWAPEMREDESPIWMSTIAEGWQPAGREFEWVMVPSLTSIFVSTMNTSSACKASSTSTA